MGIEEIVDVPYLPFGGYENPIHLSVKHYLLEVSYKKGALELQRHFIDEKGMSQGFEVSRLQCYPKSVLDGFVQNELKERYGIEDNERFIKFNEATVEEQKNILSVLLSHEDFKYSYRQLKQGYYQKIRAVQVIENEPTLTKDEFQDLMFCYRVLKDATSVVTNDEIKFYLTQADLFDKRLLLPSFNYSQQNQAN